MGLDLAAADQAAGAVFGDEEMTPIEATGVDVDALDERTDGLGVAGFGRADTKKGNLGSL
jgi:hypothetical protein